MEQVNQDLTSAWINKLMIKQSNVIQLSISSITLLLMAIILRLAREIILWIAGDVASVWASVTSEVLYIIPIIFTAVSGITALVSVILVLITDWSMPKLQELRMLWGLLGLFLLGPIATFIFALQAKKLLNQAKRVANPPLQSFVTTTETIA